MFMSRGLLLFSEAYRLRLDVLHFLALFFVLTVCTTLRLKGVPVGVGELGLLCTGVIVAVRRRDLILDTLKHYRALIALWMAYFLLLGLGGVLSLVEGRLSYGWAHDALGFGFAVSTAFVVLLAIGSQKDSFERFCISFYRIAFFLSCVAFFLIIADFVIGRPLLSPLLKANAWWSGRFSAWSVDPNQWALLMLVGCMLAVLSSERLLLWLIAPFLWLLFEVRSDSAVAGIVGFMVSYYLIVLWQLPEARKRAAATFLVFLVVIGGFRTIADRFPPSPVIRFVGLLTDTKPTQKMLNKRRAAMESGGTTLLSGNVVGKFDHRLKIWRNSITAWKVSPIVGLGPGAYAGLERPFQNTESHNLFLQLLVNVGLIGLLMAGAFVLWLVSRLWRCPDRAPWIAGMIGLLCHGLGHNMIRHPVFWLFIVLLVWQAIRRDGQRATAAWVATG